MWVVPLKTSDEQNWVIKDRPSNIILRNVTCYSVLCGFLDKFCGSFREHINEYMSSIKEGKFILEM